MQRLVLAGLGHAHLFVLEAIATGKFPRCEVIVCTAESMHVYSGMVPGWLGGRYALPDLTVNVAALCARTGATLLPQHVTALDVPARTLTLDDGTVVPFDVCSLAVGSLPAGMHIAGAREHAVPLKPLQHVERIMARLDALAVNGRGHVTVVGGGLAGVEMALASRARLASVAGGDRVTVRIVTRDATLFSERGERLANTLMRACANASIAVQLNAEVESVSATAVTLHDGRTRPSDLTIWATGPAAPPWLARSGVPVDERGFLLVDDYLRVASMPHVFAAGDCATLTSARATPKAGVYAVRMGPHLATVLGDAISGRTPSVTFQPQSRWLALVNTADGRAIASWGKLSAHGVWAMWLKDRIDRAFLSRFAS